MVRNQRNDPYSNCQNLDKVTIEHKGNGHYQIRGKVLANHYPFSKKRSLYIAGTTGAKHNIDAQKAIDYALNPHKVSGLPRKKRKSNSKEIRLRLWKKIENRKCYVCNEKFISFEETSLEHIISLVDGGLNNMNNYALSHPKCNLEKEKMKLKG